MDIIHRSNHLGKFDPTIIENFLKKLSEKDWNEFTDRQTRFKYHAKTKTIAAIFPNFKNWPELHINRYKYADELLDMIQPIVSVFSQNYNGNFIISAAMFVLLPENHNVDEHSDVHEYFGCTHRVHACISGDYKNQDFMIAGQKIKMNSGDIIEINNRLPHSVQYFGNTPRINAIIDFLPQ